MTTDVVTLTGPVDLRRIAEWASVPADTIRALNPELRRWTTPVRQDAYQLKVPAGTAAAVAEAHAATAPDEAASLQYYAVKKGESLPTIARKLRVSRADLAEANYLRANARVLPRAEAGRAARAVAGLVGPARRRPGRGRPGTDGSGRRAGRQRADQDRLPRPQGRHALRRSPASTA